MSTGLVSPRLGSLAAKRDHIELDRLIDAVNESSGSRRREALNRLCRLVFPHAFAEESVLWQAILRWVPEGEQLTLEIDREHQEINELFIKLETLDADSPEFKRHLPAARTRARTPAASRGRSRIR